MANDVLIIGAGITGLKAALTLDEFGIGSVLVEKEPEAGGRVKNYSKIFPTFSNGKLIVSDLLKEVRFTARIHLELGVEVEQVQKKGTEFQVSLNNKKILNVGAIIITTGFDTFDPVKQPEYGYGVYPNIITAVELEGLLDPDGPAKGKLLKPSDGEPVKRVAMIFCTGSRNKRLGNSYCSRICCAYSTKQAIEIKEKDRKIGVTCFYIDIRTYGKGFEEMYQYAQELGVKYVRGRASECSMDQDGNIRVRAENTLLGKPMQAVFDLVSLSVGMTPGRDTERLSKLLGLEKDKNGFFSLKNEEKTPHETIQPGIFLAGAVTGLKPIQDCIMEGVSVGGKAAVYTRKNGNRI